MSARPLRLLAASVVLASGCNAILGNEEHPFRPPNAGSDNGSGGTALGGSSSGHGGRVGNAGGSAPSAGSNAMGGDEAGAGLGGMAAEGGNPEMAGSSAGGSGARGSSGGRAGNGARGGASGDAAIGGAGAGESGTAGTDTGGTGGAGRGGSSGNAAGGSAGTSGGTAGASTGGSSGGLCGQTCFDGPASAADHGACKRGHYSCDGLNTCSGEVLPSVELCGGVNDASDENCDSTVACAGGVQAAPTTLYDNGTASGRMRIKRDAQGNEYWLGDYYQPFSIGSTTLAGGGEQGDIFYAKVSPTGTPIWVKSIVGLGWQHACDLVVHANGEFTIAGLYSTTTDEEFAIGGTSLSTPNVGSGYGFLARFDGNGDPIWVDDLEGTYSNDPRNIGIAESPDGGVYVWTVSASSLGIKHNSSTSGASINVGDVSNRTYYQYLLQIGADGAVGRTFAGAWSQSYMALSGLAVTPSNTVYVLGYHEGNAFDFGNAGNNQVGTGGYLFKLDGPTSSKGFVAQWAHNMSVRPSELALDAAGNIYVTAGNTFTKWTSAGGYDWIKTFGAFGASGVAVDAAGYVTVAGTCSGSVDFNAGGPGGGFTSSGADFCLAKFLPDGTYLWQNHVGDTAVQTAEAITTDELGYLHVLGTVQGTFDPANGKKLDAGTSTGLLHAIIYP